MVYKDAKLAPMHHSSNTSTEIQSFIMELRQKDVEYPCILCKRPVRPRQQAVECDTCHQWQHRTCDTGITQATYREACRRKEGITWQCQPCQGKVCKIKWKIK